MNLYEDAKIIIERAIKDALPDSAVKKALSEIDFQGRRIHLVAIGKAAWQMASAAKTELGDKIEDGIVITKHGYSMGEIPGLAVYEAGHPVPDEDSYFATEKAISLAEGLNEKDAVLFLISGGGSALFEKPAVKKEEIEDVTSQLLACGADITEINTVRKRLSLVKGGKFANICAPARVYSVVLSDVLGDSMDSIASGPAYPDGKTVEDALKVASKYKLVLSDKAVELLNTETPKKLTDVESYITGSVSQLVASAAETAAELGYEPVILTDMLSCQAREAGAFLGAIAKTGVRQGKKLAYIAGGETVVKLVGKGMGGRNQELALSAAREISELKGVACFSVGSDGTDGPTDAAGGFVDYLSAGKLREKGIDITKVLDNNDSYSALKAIDGLIFTGPTGTNVNDLSMLLIDGA